MLLISFAGCASMALLKRMGHPTAGGRMRAEAARTQSAYNISPVLLAIKGNADISLACRQSLKA